MADRQAGCKIRERQVANIRRPIIIPKETQIKSETVVRYISRSPRVPRVARCIEGCERETLTTNGLNLRFPKEHFMFTKKHIAIAVGSALTIMAMGTQAAQGPSSSQAPYLNAIAPGVEFASILTAGDAARNGYQIGRASCRERV